MLKTMLWVKRTERLCRTAFSVSLLAVRRTRPKEKSMLDAEVARILKSGEFERRLRPRLPRGLAVDEVLGRTWQRARGANAPAEADRTAWLLRIAVNIAKDDAKAETRRRCRERRLWCRGDSDDPSCAHHPSDSRRPQPQDEPAHEEKPSAALERRELRRAILTAVRTARLPRNHRCALWARLRDRLGKWAAGRGIPAPTARVWAKRARDALRPHLVAAGLGAAGT